MLTKLIILQSVFALLSAPVVSSPGAVVEPVNTVEGYTAVYDDLHALEFDRLHFYQQGLVSQNELLRIIEDEEGYVYLYIYRTVPSMTYDRVDISTRSDIDTEGFVEDYKTYNLVEISHEDYLVKYKVAGLKADTKVNRRYAVRQAYNYATSDYIGDILDISLEYLICKDDEGVWYEQYNKIDSVTVDGLCAYQLRYLGRGDQGGGIRYSQRYYYVFNTSYPLEDIFRIDVRYSYQFVSGTTDIGVDLTDLNGDKLKNDLTGVERITKIDSQSPVYSETVHVEPGTVNYRIIKPWFFKRADYSYDKIQRTEDVPDLNESLRSYEWVVTFLDNEIYALGRFVDWFTTRWHVEDFVHVHKSSVMTMKAKVDGEIKELTVIDAYNDSQGNIPIEPEEEQNIWERILEAWQNVFAGKADFLDWFVVVISAFAGLIALYVASFVLKIVAFILKIFIPKARG